MEKIIIPGVFLVLLLLISCVESSPTSKKVEEVTGNLIINQPIKETESEKPIEIPKEIIKKPLSCTNECSQPICDGSYHINCLVGDDGCKDKFDKEKIKGKCGVECLRESDCPNGETCLFNKCEEKPDIQSALEETKKVLENYQEKTSKLDECTKLCAGDEYNIPYVKNEWYSVCYQLYYYAGESALDEQIADCK